MERGAQLSTGARQLPADLESGFASLPTVSSLLCRFLDEVQSHSDVNKMSVQNLATVFGPNILRPQREDPVTIMEGNGGGCMWWCWLLWAHVGPGQVLRTLTAGQQEGWPQPWALGSSLSGPPHCLLQPLFPHGVSSKRKRNFALWMGS